MKLRGLVPLLLLAGAAASAAPTAAPVRAEIDRLLARLQASGCEFNRNGSWYSGAQARDHLLRKLEAVESRTTVQSAEQFIALAAAGSSVSGTPYQVRCGAEPAVESRVWLGRQLAILRTAAGNGKP